MSPSTHSTPTRERILLAAERLFATRGIGRTSVRMIIEAAEANLGALNYHFGSKHSVIAEVFQRVATPINDERGARLAELKRGRPNAPYDLRAILEALYWPVFHRFVGPRRSEGWSGLSIIMQLRSDPSDVATSILESHENSFAPEFDRAFAQTLGVDGLVLRRAIWLVNSAVWDLVGNPVLLHDIGRDASGAAELQQVFEQFLDFGTAGMQAACAPRHHNTAAGGLQP